MDWQRDIEIYQALVTKPREKLFTDNVNAPVVPPELVIKREVTLAASAEKARAPH